jgi:hypothetical protein
MRIPIHIAERNEGAEAPKLHAGLPEAWSIPLLQNIGLR